MFLFPIIYIISFFYGLSRLLNKQIDGLVIFMILGLPVYTNALSVSYMYGFEKWIPLLQSLKEIMVLASFYLVVQQIYHVRQIKWHLVDKCIMLFFGYTLLYTVIPIGSYAFFPKLLALKNLSFFPFLYFIGRFCDASKLQLNKIFSFMIMVIMVAAIVAIGERFMYQHLHSFTGYSIYNTHFFDADMTGSYGLQWTFESSAGFKRFGSIFSNPLDFAAGVVMVLSVLLALISHPIKREENHFVKIKPNQFETWGLLACLICIFLAGSRASFISFFIILYFFAWLSKQKKVLFYFHLLVATVIIYVFFFLEGDMRDLILDTISFQDTSSIGHVVEWIAGIEAMIEKPLGLGLGESGRVAIANKDNIGGENQFIIIGVQVGVFAMLLYLFIYIQLIWEGIKNLGKSEGLVWKVILSVVLLKIGLFLPMMTSYVDSYIYISFLSWFLSGLMINLIQAKKQSHSSNFLSTTNA